MGIIRSRVSGIGDFLDDVTRNDLGINIGGGINGQFTDNVGIRGDLRYFRSLEDNSNDSSSTSASAISTSGAVQSALPFGGSRQ